MAGLRCPAEGLQGFGLRMDVAWESREERVARLGGAHNWEEPTLGTFGDHCNGGYKQSSQVCLSLLKRGDMAYSSLGRVGNLIPERIFRCPVRGVMSSLSLCHAS